MKIKDDIRQEFKAKRESAQNDPAFAARIIENVKRLLEEFLFGSNLIVSVYYPIENEINVLPLVKWLEEKKIICAIPKIRLSKGNDMDFLIFNSNTPTKNNAFNIPEPSDSKVVVPDIIILPVLVCDLNGNRIGYGRGYYDAYLNKIKKTEKK